MSHPRRLVHRWLAVAGAWSVLATGAAHGAELPVLEVSRTDHRPTGNRIASGTGNAGTPIDVALPSRPTWVLPAPRGFGAVWLVALEDGSVITASLDQDLAPSVSSGVVATLRPGEPPLARHGDEGVLMVLGAEDAPTWFDDAVPGARAIHAADGAVLALTGPTRRYPHGVLGDDLEASAVSVRASDGTVNRVEVRVASVIEGLSPILADLGNDGSEEIIVTVSDVAGGAKELVVVRTPHIGGSVESYRLSGDRLERVASEPGYSSHRLGSPNLDMALLADADGDGHLDIVVPTQDLRTLGVLTRRGDGFALIGSLPLDGTLVTNLAATADDDGRLVLAAGTDDGRLSIFR